MLGTAICDFILSEEDLSKADQKKEGQSKEDQKYKDIKDGIYEIFFQAHAIQRAEVLEPLRDSHDEILRPLPTKLSTYSLLAFDHQSTINKPKEVKLKQTSFSLFVDADVRLAAEVVKKFIETQNASLPKNDPHTVMMEIVQLAKEYLEKGYHPDFVKYVFTTFINHSDPAIKKFKSEVPLVQEFSPRHFFNLIEGGTNLRHTEDVDPTGHYYFKTPELQLAYWRDDMNLNSHHWNWHTVYPAGGVCDANPKGKCGEKENPYRRKDRQGELFMYMHSQLIARYDAERIAFGLYPVRPFLGESFSGIISQGNDSHLASFTPRAPNLQFADLTSSKSTATRAEMRKWADRLLTAVETGRLERFTKPPSLRQEFDILNMELLGQIVEADPHSSYYAYYGNLHNTGHNLISRIHDPDGELQSIDGVMGDVITSVRDPVFFEWHKLIDNYAIRFQTFLGPHLLDDLKNIPTGYTEEAIKIDNISLEEYQHAWFDGKNIKLENPKQTDTLHTYMEKKTAVLFFDASLVGWQLPDLQTGRGAISSERTFAAINNIPFQYNITVTNGRDHGVSVWVRIFIVPVENELINDFKKWIEMDKFQCPLQQGKNFIRRQSFNSSIVQMLGNDPFTYLNDNGDHHSDRDVFCRCGLPANLLLPRGRTGKGQKFVLSVMVTNEEPEEKHKDKESQSSCCKRASSYCGSSDPDGTYPDKRPLGYPLDRPFLDKYNRQTVRPWLNKADDKILVSHIGSIKEIYFNISHQWFECGHPIVEAREKLNREILKKNRERVRNPSKKV